MDIRPIRTEDDYDWALQEIGTYFAAVPEPGTAEADRFDILANLIEAYESKRWRIDPVDPVEAIRYRMELSDFTQTDLARVIGSRSRASEILNRKRPLTLSVIQRLHQEWAIPAEVLIAPYHLDGAA